jgi:hypothetical protein
MNRPNIIVNIFEQLIKFCQKTIKNNSEMPEITGNLLSRSINEIYKILSTTGKASDFTIFNLNINLNIYPPSNAICYSICNNVVEIRNSAKKLEEMSDSGKKIICTYLGIIIKNQRYHPRWNNFLATTYFLKLFMPIYLKWECANTSCMNFDRDADAFNEIMNGTNIKYQKNKHWPCFVGSVTNSTEHFHLLPQMIDFCNNISDHKYIYIECGHSH